MCKFIIKNLKLKNFYVLVFLTLFLSNFISVAKSEIIEGFCLVKRSDLKAANISEGDYSRFLGKEINYLVSFDEMVLADISDDTKLSYALPPKNNLARGLRRVLHVHETSEDASPKTKALR